MKTLLFLAALLSFNAYAVMYDANGVPIPGTESVYVPDIRMQQPHQNWNNVYDQDTGRSYQYTENGAGGYNVREINTPNPYVVEPRWGR